MRVAMVIQNFFPVIGGAEGQALALATGLVNAGIDIDVLTRRHSAAASTEEKDGVRIHRLFTLGTGLLNAFFFSLSLAVHLFLNYGRYDLYHIHLASSHALVPAFLSRLFQKRVIIKVGGSFQIGELALSRNSLLGRLKLRFLIWTRPVIVVVNQGQVEELKQSGMAQLRTIYIPNGVDLQRFHPAPPATREKIRAELKWEKFIFLFVGRFAPDKLRMDIFERLLFAWSRFIRRFPRHRFIFVGKGPLEPDYKNAVAASGLSDSIEILGPSDRVDTLFQAADVFILPSITEGLSNALLEAMASGLPVIGSRVPGVIEIVKDLEHGFLFDPFDDREMESAFEKISQNQTGRTKMSERCIDTAQGYSLKETVNKTLALYKELAA